MNPDLIMTLIVALIVLAACCEKKIGLYFLVYGLFMLSLNFITIQMVPGINPEYAHYYYLFSAGIISYLTYFIPKKRENSAAIYVCGATISADILGEILWRLGLYPSLYANIFTGIYVVACLYLIKKGAINAVYGGFLSKLRVLSFHLSQSHRRYLGGHK